MVYFLINILKEVPQDCISSWLCARYLFWCFFLLGAILNQHQLSTEMGLGVLHSAALKDNAFFFKYFFKKEFRDIIENNVSEDSPVQFFFSCGYLFSSPFMANPNVFQNMLKPLVTSSLSDFKKTKHQQWCLLTRQGHAGSFWALLSALGASLVHSAPWVSVMVASDI